MNRDIFRKPGAGKPSVMYPSPPVAVPLALVDILLKLRERQFEGRIANGYGNTGIEMKQNPILAIERGSGTEDGLAACKFYSAKELFNSPTPRFKLTR